MYWHHSLLLMMSLRLHRDSGWSKVKSSKVPPSYPSLCVFKVRKRTPPHLDKQKHVVLSFSPSVQFTCRRECKFSRVISLFLSPPPPPPWRTYIARAFAIRQYSYPSSRIVWIVALHCSCQYKPQWERLCIFCGLSCLRLYLQNYLRRK